MVLPTHPLGQLLTAALLSLMLLCLSSAPATASEQQLTLANGMVATYNSGDDSKPVTGAVLMIHGWASQMNEVGDMFARLAEQLADQGIASLRINIRGESEREKSNFTLTSTFASRVEDGQTGLDYLRKTHPKLPIGVVGFSLGGATAIGLTGNNPKAVTSLVLWSSAGNPAYMLTGVRDPVAVKRAIDTGQAVVHAWVDLTITREHLLGMVGYDIFPPMQAYEGALLSIRGSDDYVEPIETELFANANAAPEDFYQIGGADHIFHSLEPDSDFDERVISHTVNWLTATLH
ncbi:alpha/beta hydrolase [Halioxenophilus sp. WMMB6]|uniref:alpha/beta hydrolase n=1 Tax=Halioxenophilus sp. WMMB6 TaxID=3073815 RepID=UPI00295EEA8A|nr:alpha/beta fold hydrolase [Halioxenophilus sp. WMMB6]